MAATPTEQMDSTIRQQWQRTVGDISASQKCSSVTSHMLLELDILLYAEIEREEGKKESAYVHNGFLDGYI